jgi:hypothetical protein
MVPRVNRRLQRWRTGAVLASPLALLLASCSSTPCETGASIFFVELPAGTDSVSSFEATGACGIEFGGCTPIAANCSTSGCACQYVVQVNANTFGADSVCHVSAISKTGQVFMQDFPFTRSSSSCFAVTGQTGVVTVAFTGAGVVDAGANDSGGGD